MIEGFTQEFRDAVDGMSWEEIAEVCKASMPTVQRWYYGKSAPHRVGRDSVFSAIQTARATPS